MAKVGVIGLGTIGSGVAICLARAGMLAAVYDVRVNAADGLEGVPPLAGLPAEVARVCDTIVIAVVNAAQVIDVLSGLEACSPRHGQD
jgi:3-hydroxyisobutyrate dehydrogenase-like beta-hydroxyacid dehydrogenase